ncbi:hypothetical protein J3F84DRAFT_376183 [Trichoderma pleuroticola]
MLIIQSTSANLSGATISNIQALAEQVICYSKDMEYMPDRSDLLRLPATLLPSASLQLAFLPRTNQHMQDFLYTLANQKGFTIESNQSYLEPQLLWLQSGGISTREDRLTFTVILPRPRGVNDETPEPLSKGFIERPIGQGQFVRSSFQCRVGDIIILEGGERIWVPREDNIEPCGVCLLYQSVAISRHPTGL